MSVGGVGGTSYKFWLVQNKTAKDGSLTSIKIDSVQVSPEVGSQLPGSTIEFEFVQVETTSANTETLSLAGILIGLNK
ncbi:MAG: hypothetical protein IPM35_30030 [Myxococcales bacterium]|nr:hypothetical protein [Myxococcales bacterium]